MNLTELGISHHQVFNAYKKLKHYFFYDNSTLFVREKIATFEASVLKDGLSIDDLKSSLFHRVDKVYRDIVAGKFENKAIGIFTLPKKIKSVKSDITTNSNKQTDDIVVEKLYYFIDASVEIHVLSTLWVMYVGRFLNRDLLDSCYANKLDLDINKEYEEPYENLRLFKPYFVQYQNWRDDAIQKAESLLDEKKDVTILSLDIKDYYHSIKLDFSKINKSVESNIEKYFKHNANSHLKDSSVNISTGLNKIIEYVHKVYFQKIRKEDVQNKDVEDSQYGLPIGLLSSCFLGNYYLKDFDRMVVNNINPAFYGRYVDDMMFVFADIQVTTNEREISPTLRFLYDNFYKKDVLDIVESSERDKLFCTDELGKFKLKNYEFLSEEIKKYADKSQCELKTWINSTELMQGIVNSLEFKIRNPQIGSSCYASKDVSNSDMGSEHLLIQTSKTVLHFLKQDESRAVLNIFKKKLEKQRSEFRFLPDEDEISEQFDEEAFNLKYNDSENKFRSIEDFSENKYGASKFLAKKIFALSFGDRQENDDETDKQILTFFKETTALKFYSLWEKVATYFVLRNRPDNLIIFKRNIQAAIAKVALSKNIGDENKCLKNIGAFLGSSLSIALALNPELKFKYLDSLERNEMKYFTETLSMLFRRSNLFRVSLISIPGINFTNLSPEPKSLINNDFNSYFKTVEGEIKLDGTSCLLAPYYAPFHEFNILKIVCTVSTLSENDFIHEANNTVIKQQEIKNEQESGENVDPSTGKPKDPNTHKEHIDKINNIPNDAFKWYHKCNYDWKYLKKTESATKDKYFKIIPTDINSSNELSLKSYEIEVVGENDDDDISNKENKRIALANIKVEDSNVQGSYLGKPNLDKNRRKTMFRLLNEADELKSDLTVFPEVSFPYSWLRLLVERSHKRYMGIVAGLEHWININNIAFNFMVTILPFKIQDNITSLIKIRLKNHYSHYERHLLTGYRLLIPKETLKGYKMSYDLFHWRKSYFSVYNCFELADIYHRSLFKSKVDFIVASEFNKDTKYFSDVAGAWVRDVHSYFIQVNSSNYGDSRLIQPAGSYKKDLIQVKGGLNSTVLVGDLDIKKIREFQLMEYHLQKDNIERGKYDFKPTPPDLDRKNVKIRIEDKSFGNG